MAVTLNNPNMVSASIAAPGPHRGSSRRYIAAQDARKITASMARLPSRRLEQPFAHYGQDAVRQRPILDHAGEDDSTDHSGNDGDCFVTPRVLGFARAGSRH